LQIVGGYVFYPSTLALSVVDAVVGVVSRPVFDGLVRVLELSVFA
jgi:hypothetical protein